MSETRITNIDEYIQKIDCEIERYKAEGKHKYYLVNILFGDKNYIDDFRLYFSRKGMALDVKKCGCSEPRYDYIILEWR